MPAVISLDIANEMKKQSIDLSHRRFNKKSIKSCLILSIMSHKIKLIHACYCYISIQFIENLMCWKLVEFISSDVWFRESEREKEKL